MKNKAMIKLIVSTQGIIRTYNGETKFYNFFQTNKHISDCVHINDKIALMTLLDDARIGKKNSAQSLFRFVDHNGLFVNFHINNAHLDMNGINLDCYIASEDNLIEDPIALEIDKKHQLNVSNQDVPPLTIAAHEMREPLNAIIGFTDFLLHAFSSKLENEKQKQYATYIKQSGLHLLAIIEHYLDENKTSQAENMQNVDSIITESIAITAHLTNNRKVLFTPTPHKLYFSTLKSVELKQIFVNLITNAAKYSHDDSVITIQSRILKNDSILLTISDTGIGIAAEEIDDIRHPFKRAKRAISSNIEGQGIGLSLVFSIVEAAKGTISISSKKNSGTTISITLPLSHTIPINTSNGYERNNNEDFSSISTFNRSCPVQLREKYTNNGENKEKIDKIA